MFSSVSFLTDFQGMENGAEMWSIFWRNRFHGCFMLHCPLVFCLALAWHNVNLKQGGLGVGVFIKKKIIQSLRACMHRRMQAAVHSTVFRALNNNHANSLISVRPVSLCVFLDSFLLV